MDLRLRRQRWHELLQRRELPELLLSYHLSLDHGIVWAFEAAGAAAGWLEGFARAMGLSPGDGKADRCIHFEAMPRKTDEFFGPCLRRYSRSLPAREWKLREFHDLILFEHPAVREVICELDSGVDGPARVDQMRLAMLPIYTDSLRTGGLPVHGALVEIGGSGVILAGRSGEGKSTACRRLEAPWRVLGDDLCLVVPCASGGFRAHPLPTWSALKEDGEARVWQSGSSVPLRAIFFLEQSAEDECLDLKRSSTAITLAASALQVFRSIDFAFPRSEEQEVKKGLYTNAASMALEIPSHLLRLSLTGRFWEKIEEVLEKQAGNSIAEEPHPVCGVA
jgi:SynChlorMet cassette protein ScmC